MKPRNKRARKLSLAELGRIALLALLCLATVVVTVQVSVAGAFRDRLPQLTLRFEPADADAQATLAGLIASADHLSAAGDTAQSLARGAVRRSPLSPVALRALGVMRADPTQSVNPDPSAAKLFDQAERLSRRDLTTQIWLAELSLKRGDIPAMLRHFDVALRTSAADEDSIFPLLASASSDKRVADALVVRMRARPDWAQPFANYLLGGQVSPAISAYIFKNALDSKNPDDRKLIENLMQRLALMGQMDVLRDVRERFNLSPKGQALVTNGGFEASAGVAPFTWSLTGDTDLWAAREPGPRGGKVLALSASNGRSGDLARQLVELRPGSYRLSADIGNVPNEVYLRPKLAVRCADRDQTELAAVRPTHSGLDAQRVSASVVVPQNCGLQWLVISMSGGDSEPNELPWVDNVALVSSGA